MLKTQTFTQFYRLVVKNATFVAMSWLLYLPLKRVCTNCKSSFTPTLRSYSSLWTPQARCKTRLSKQSFVRQRRQFFVRQSVTIYKSRFWIFGIGTGIILGLGLKCHIDFNESSCEYIINNDMGRKSGRYLPAIQVSRDLARRIKVGQQVFRACFAVSLSQNDRR